MPLCVVGGCGWYQVYKYVAKSQPNECFVFSLKREALSSLLLSSPRRDELDELNEKRIYLEVLLAPHESITSPPSFGVHVAFDMELASQPLGPAEEDTTLAGGVDFTDRSEDHVPVGTAEVGRGAETGDGVGVAAVEDDVGGVGGGDLGCEILEDRCQLTDCLVG